MAPKVAPYVADENLVFHYTKASTALEHILAEGRIRLSPVAETNDPGDPPPFPDVKGRDSDLDPGIRAYLDAAVGHHMAAGEHKLVCFARDAKGSVQATRGVSSRLGWARDRMWAQYGDSHRGLCLAFDRSQLESNAKELADRGEREVYCRDVKYNDHIAYPEWRYERAAGGDPETRYREWERQILPVHYFSKRADWAAESEYRVLLLDHSREAKGYAYFHIDNALRFFVVGSKFSRVYDPCVQEACERLGVPSYRYELSGRVARLGELYAPR